MVIWLVSKSVLPVIVCLRQRHTCIPSKICLFSDHHFNCRSICWWKMSLQVPVMLLHSWCPSESPGGRTDVVWMNPSGEDGLWKWGAPNPQLARDGCPPAQNGSDGGSKRARGTLLPGDVGNNYGKCLSNHRWRRRHRGESLALIMEQMPASTLGWMH